MNQLTELLEMPMWTTETHDYIVLPADRWHLAMPLIIDLVGADAPIADPSTSSLLAAISLASGEIEGVMFVETVILADRFACRPGSGVSFSSMHHLVRLVLPPGTVYYAAVATGSERAAQAADRAGLVPHADLRVGIGAAGADNMTAAVGVEAADALDVGSGGGRSSR